MSVADRSDCERFAKMMTPEERLVRNYFDAFNRRDIEGVMACFDEDAIMIAADGRRLVGRAEVRRSYEQAFMAFPDGRCDLRAFVGSGGYATVESVFRGTSRERGTIELRGVETVEIVGGRIREIRDYHQRVSPPIELPRAAGPRLVPPRARVYR
jgi:taurine dehydrogenase small subunit